MRSHRHEDASVQQIASRVITTCRDGRLGGARFRPGPSAARQIRAVSEGPSESPPPPDPPGSEPDESATARPSRPGPAHPGPGRILGTAITIAAAEPCPNVRVRS
jgi:hypothetical protein